MKENLTIENHLSKRQKFFAKWLLFEKSLNELKSDKLFSDLYDKEKTPTAKAEIVHLYILSYHINELLCIDDITIKDIVTFGKHKDFLKKYNNEDKPI